MKHGSMLPWVSFVSSLFTAASLDAIGMLLVLVSGNPAPQVRCKEEPGDIHWTPFDTHSLRSLLHYYEKL